jgi:hypothetical protein
LNRRRDIHHEIDTNEQTKAERKVKDDTMNQMSAMRSILYVGERSH